MAVPRGRQRRRAQPTTDEERAREGIRLLKMADREMRAVLREMCLAAPTLTDEQAREIRAALEGILAKVRAAERDLLGRTMKLPVVDLATVRALRASIGKARR